ncbi:MAG: phosphomannomutase, partial [Acidimicrobiales bacterium]|nr:phosphomannomutase [Acidimicrobiales bacterium]
LVVHLDGAVADAYVAAAARIGVVPAARTVRLASTALHGVGAVTLRRVLAAAGFAPAAEATDQADPDPDFPTVAFPNPEEPGALDHGVARAVEVGADLLLANDPDADRLGAAVPDPAGGPPSTAAGWRSLRGDEIGVVLADHLLRHGGVGAGGVLATTIVSSTLLSKMAAAAGVAFVETLTGFKWISRAARPGQHLAFGYEEALGYCVGELVGDKDGITAAVLLAEAVASLAAEGHTVLDVLDDLARRHGVHATGQWSARVAGAGGLAELAAAMAALRASPPAALAGRAVQEITDLAAGDPTRALPPSDVLVLRLAGARVVVRPSGTEPKLKCYVEVVEPVVDGDLPAARTRAAAELAALVAAAAGAIGLSAV